MSSLLCDHCRTFEIKVQKVERAERDFSVAISETTATIQGFQDTLDIFRIFAILGHPILASSTYYSFHF